MTRRRKKTKVKKKTKAKKTEAKDPLTKREMLRRIPNKPFLTTPEVQHVFNDCHVMTIYKKVQRGLLIRFRRHSSRKANIYKREDVIAAVETWFSLRSADTTIRETDAEKDQAQEARATKKRTTRKTTKRGAANRVGKKKKRRRETA